MPEEVNTSITPSTFLEGISFKESEVLGINDLTQRKVSGDGYFDALMESVKNHLKEEYDKNRISGAEYTKAYIALTQSAMSTATQYLLQKDTAYWQGINAQAEVVLKQVTIDKGIYEVNKVLPAQVSKLEMETSLLEYEKDNILPVQVAKLNYEVSNVLPAQVSKLSTETSLLEYEETNILPKKKEALELQLSKATFEFNKILPKQDELIKAQVAKERAATSDKSLVWTTLGTGADKATEGSANVSGVIGLQKLLYVQQEKTYKQDTINNTMQHLYSAWSAGITNGTSGISAPAAIGTAGFNTSVTSQLNALKLNSNFS